ncbi:MAG: hypothetical protein F6J87_26460 [Spirulina sp. SIO3F2]|nr:hypothetical protein [Spirulina sp. SIO3F2]
MPTLFSRFRGSLRGRAQLATVFPDAIAPLYRQVEQAVLSHTGALERLELGAIALPDPPEVVLAALLPLILYSHELPIAQQTALSTLSQHWPQPWPKLLQGWSAALRLIVSGGVLDAQQLAQAADQPQIVDWLTQGYSLGDIITSQLDRSGSPDLTVALYCFCATPEAPNLILNRAAQYSPTAAALALILTGAHHGESPLPLPPGSPADCTFATQLWNHWSGAYLPPAHASPMTQIGAAHTLQPRPRRTLISLVGQ